MRHEQINQRGLFKRISHPLTLITLLLLPPTAAGQGTPPRAGDLDTSFSGDGKVITDFGGSSENATAVAIQPDGKIVVAGYSFLPTNLNKTELLLARYLSNGALDTSFSGDGKVRGNFGGNAKASAVAIQPNGRILVAGTISKIVGGSNLGSILVARYFSNGTLDTTFSGDGWVTTEIGNNATVSAMTLQPDGKILVAGTADLDDFLVARYLPNGTLDPTFNGIGWTTTDIIGTEQATSLVLQPDGKIVVAGTLDFSQLLLVRYLPNGALDSTFNDIGWVSDRVGNIATAIAVQPDGKILAAGLSGIESSRQVSVMARFVNNGMLDPEFGNGGGLRIDFGTGFMHTATALGLQPDGKIVVAGFVLLQTGQVDMMALARYSSSGILDATFGGDGNVVTDFGSGRQDHANALLIQPRDGRLVVAGSSLPLALRKPTSPWRVITRSPATAWWSRGSAPPATTPSPVPTAPMSSTASAATTSSTVWRATTYSAAAAATTP